VSISVRVARHAAGAMLLFLLAGCAAAPRQPLVHTFACVDQALGTKTPPVRVELIAVTDMRQRFGDWQGYFTAVRAPEPTIFLTHDASRAVHVHEVSRAVLYHAGKSLRPDLDHKARRACGGVG